MEVAVRALAAAAGVAVHELPEKNRCCGHGGHIRLANPSLYEEMVQRRTQAADLPYLVYCANCRDIFACAGKHCAHILDVTLGLKPDPAIPTLEQKRQNSLRVKTELMKRLQGVDFQPTRYEWDDVLLLILPEVQRHMEQKLIASAEVREAIWQAERSGDVFVDETAGTRLAAMMKPVVTYWVEYREVGPHTYEVLSAYSHRLRFRQQGESHGR